jgi:hypothetical protein
LFLSGRLTWVGNPFFSILLGNLWRQLVLPKSIDNWSLTSLQQQWVKDRRRLVKHASYYWRKPTWRGGGSGRWCEGLPLYRWRRARCAVCT